MIDNPTLPDPATCIERDVMRYGVVRALAGLSGTRPRCTITYAEHLESAKEYLTLIARLRARHPELVVYDPTPFFCDVHQRVCPLSKDGSFLYSVTDHMSDFANAAIARQLLPLLDAAVAPGAAGTPAR